MDNIKPCPVCGIGDHSGHGGWRFCNACGFSARCAVWDRLSSQAARIARLEKAAQHSAAMLATCSEHITLVAEEMGCSAGNPDGGSPDTCEHCIDLRSARVILDFVGELNALLEETRHDD